MIGLPPDWYKARAIRSWAVREPRPVVLEFGEVRVEVHGSTADLRYLVQPMGPAGAECWSEDRLAATVTRDCMIETELPRA